MPHYPAAKSYGAQAPRVKLASNESPYPPLPEVIAAAEQALHQANRYPDPHGRELKAALSDYHGVAPAQIALGNGADDLLLTVAAALLEPGTEVIYGWPSFSIYPHLAALSGADEVRVPLTPHHRYDLDRIAAAVTSKTRLVVVCNPNNPTSTAIPAATIAEFARQLPADICLLVDEAYCDFNTLDALDALVPLLQECPNLLLVRTFSKAYSLCGLRIGYGLAGSTDLVQALSVLRPPFFNNVVAPAAATAAIHNRDKIADRVELILAARHQLAAGLQELDFSPAQSEANFCWFSVGTPAAEQRIAAALLQQGILVRAGTPLGCPGSLRVTAGTPAETGRFLAALAKVRSVCYNICNG